jgi:hypothetical protein
MELRIDLAVRLKGFTLNASGRSLIYLAERRLAIAVAAVAMLSGLAAAAESQAVSSQRAHLSVEQVSQHGRAWSVRPPSTDHLAVYGRAWSVGPPSTQLASYRSGWSRVAKPARVGSVALRSTGRAWRR